MSVGVLHIVGDFPNQQVYPELVTHLARRGLAQTVHSVVRSQAEAARRPSEPGNVKYYVRHRLRPWHRLLFRRKIQLIAREIRRDMPRNGVDLIHAHSLYSDGAVALRLKQESGTPFLSAVRNADVNAFMRYRPDLHRVRDAVLREAGCVIFLSPAYRSMLLRRLRPSLRAAVEEKSLVVPNGVAPCWIAWEPDPSTLAAPPGEVLRLLYVGDFTRNKNLPNLLAAAGLVAARRPVRLTLVGDGGDGQAEVRRLVESGGYAFASLTGRVEHGPRLRDIYRAHDIFVMPSITETFGVAYVEALSQGLPVVHSHGQGISGYFPEGTVSEAVDHADPGAIARGIETLAARCHQVRAECVAQAKRFEWGQIARQYEEAYRAVSGQVGPRGRPA